MRSTLVVTTPATSLQLLSIEEMRVAAGLAADDVSQDDALEARGLSVAASIMSYCNIAIGEGANPTLNQETLTETFYQVCTEDLVLARRHNVEIISNTVDDELLETGEYFSKSEAGMVSRICAGHLVRWQARKIVVVYKAGFETVPSDLKLAATDFFVSLSQGRRDPLVKSQEIEIPGLQTKRTDYWVGSVPGMATENAVPDVVAGQLKRFRNTVLG